MNVVGVIFETLCILVARNSWIDACHVDSCTDLHGTPRTGPGGPKLKITPRTTPLGPRSGGCRLLSALL